ncbi:hypothetical protein AAZX31_17G203200 [Glycine max]|uniref:DUF868 domain-containing protein n=2 Tax=Glycine subgen. Soja TaxID=1462606 RepID=I1MWX9_SOYBN|nr:uncharacterized protein LOC100819926 [Glycine max]XP_028211739.1 uncharacterized protein LOC114394260 [Glycine soja]KAG4931355.1 hypothetical protein JHK86_048316 [Glycine max]KAG5103379.1 hypothetical protein JHK84_048348 [Glycine max]KAH1119507.1 hypothetical protein GYH30_048048 [Glycine max]KAH1203651.1 hypothetical protein GmHk_17G049833 [Glycine max]KHN22514.1 hypothetical protein glysoja_036218 [Glycine soja]|eukprot:XP_003549308.1 uncharacterized protein LOC100819926 [Glycine max]
MFFLSSPFSSCFRASQRTNHDPTNLTTYIYHTEYGTVSLTWSRSLLGRSLHVNLHNRSSFHLLLKPWKKNGSKKLSHNTVFLWNLSNARFESGLEPRSRFYLAIEVEHGLSLLIGDLSPRSSKAKKPSKTNQLLVLKRDNVHVAPHRSRVYQTKAKLGGKVREIEIDCDVYNCGGYGYENENSSRLLFSVDGEKVLEVARLKWKFRGSERVEIDGVHVQISWDVHDWLFEKDKDIVNHRSSNNNNSNNNGIEGHAVFMFKFEEDEVRGSGGGKEEEQQWSMGSGGEWRNGKSWSSSSLSVSSTSGGSFGGSSSVMEWSSVEENELVVPLGFSLVVYAWRR